MSDLPAIAPPSSREVVQHVPPADDGRQDLDIAVESSPVSSSPVHAKNSKLTAARMRTPRVRPPKDSKVYKVALAIIALRAKGSKMSEISETLGYTPDTLRQYLHKAHKKGWLNFDSFTDPNDQLEYVLQHKVVRNLNEFLDERDKDVTIEAAKGTGLFKTHQIVKGEGATMVGVALRVQVDMPPSTKESVVTIRPGSIGGSPGHDIPVDAEIVENEER